MTDGGTGRDTKADADEFARAAQRASAADATPAERWSRRLAYVGCLGFVLPFVVAFATLVVVKVFALDPPQVRPWGVPVLVVCGAVFVGSVGASLVNVYVLQPGILRRRLHRPGWHPAPEPSDADVTVRMLAALIDGDVMGDSTFPGPLAADLVIDRPRGQVRLALTKIRVRRRSAMRPRATVPPFAYLWVDLPRPLPGRVVRRSLRTGVARAGHLDIEDERFNRRYEVSRWPATVAGYSGLDDAQFQRYASALLTPRVAETILGTADAQMLLAVRDRRLLALSVVDPVRVETVADQLLAVRFLLPRWVLADYGG